MAPALDWRSRGNWRVAWVATSPRTVPGRERARYSASRCSSWGKPMADRIAIVEDERLVRELVAVNLRHAGYEIVSAENFVQGRELLACKDYQLAILDVMRRGDDSFALTRFAHEQGVDVPILILTARADTNSKVPGLDAGAADYLP